MTREDIEWVLTNLQDLERGLDPDPSGVEQVAIRVRRMGWAGFENPAGLAGAVSGWLDKCGDDGLLAYLSYCFGRNEEWTARVLKMSLDRLRRRMNLAINYVVYLSNPVEEGQRRMVYAEWCSRHNHPSRYSKWDGGIIGAHLQTKSVV